MCILLYILYSKCLSVDMSIRYPYYSTDIYLSTQLCRIFFLSPKQPDGSYRKLIYLGGLLLTNPEEDFNLMGMADDDDLHDAAGLSRASVGGDTPHFNRAGGIQVRIDIMIEQAKL